MDKLIFSEEFCQPENLHPFTLTRQIQDIRVGILTIREKWEKMFGLPSFDKKEDDYKDLDRSVYIDNAVGNGACFIIHGNVLPTARLVKLARRLRDGEFIATRSGMGILFRITKKQIQDKHKIIVTRAVALEEEVQTIQYPWDIFRLNDWAIRQDFSLLIKKRKSQPISRTNKVVGRGNVFLEKGARVEHCVLNAAAGPIYIGRQAEIMEGAMIRGPFAMGADSCVKMGARIYGATTLGPGCVVGGEVKNSVLFGYSNKAHDGYLGDSVVGEWCNLGAGTTNSNLKNNASDVQLWTPRGRVNAGRKCGIMMGDYTRTAINTSFTTGTVVGVCSNVFGTGLTPAYIPSFSWGSDGIQRYEFEKAIPDIDDWKQLKGKRITENEKLILKHVFDNY
ncbi:MAG TPA: putative sugar nucleotidyl transferase [Chitinophagaceae bacterium]|nr:putative sugar nucleotidyl transferase [Chitinophagaceae bacterium]